VKKLIHPVIRQIEKLYEEKKQVTGTETGFLDLDHLTSGLQPGDFIVLAARPSMGKTSLALNIGANVGIRGKKGVGIFSLEMSMEQLLIRILCSEARVSAHRLRTGYLRDKEWPLLIAAAGELAEAPIYIDDSGSMSILEMRAKARRLKSEVDLGLIVVDYMQLMRGVGRHESRQQEISEISRGLKSLAKELGVPVLALSQLSRPWNRAPTTGRSSPTCGSRGPSSRTPTSSVSSTARSTTRAPTTTRAWGRSSSASSGTARWAWSGWRSSPSTPGSRTSPPPSRRSEDRRNGASRSWRRYLSSGAVGTTSVSLV
jgi:replicative DNA helicase